MNIKKITSTILAAMLTVGVCSHIAFGNGNEERVVQQATSSAMTSKSGNTINSLKRQKINTELRNTGDESADLFAVEGESSEDVAMLMNDDGFYIIETAEQLAAIGNSSTALKSNYKLGCDITLPDEWKPINNVNWEDELFGDNPIDYENYADYFEGVLDGNGYTITMSGFYEYNDVYDDWYKGIFEVNYGEIRNLKINLKPSDKKYANGALEVGIICGENYGTIKNCSVSGKFSYMVEHSVSDSACTFADFGGITGYNYNLISECSVTADIFTDCKHRTVGGVAGFNGFYGSIINGEMICDYEGNIENCYYRGYLNAYASDYVGGLVGWNACHIKNSYSSSPYSGNIMGGLVGNNHPGYNEEGKITADKRSIINSYYSGVAGEEYDNGSGTLIDIENMSDPRSYKGFDFVSTWGIDEETGLPYLLWEQYGTELGMPEFNIGEIEKSIDTTDPSSVNMSVNVSIENKEERSIPVEVLVSVYDEEERQRGFERVQIMLEPGDNKVSLNKVPIRTYDQQEEYYGKIMIWSSILDMRPLVNQQWIDVQ